MCWHPLAAPVALATAAGAAVEGQLGCVVMPLASAVTLLERFAEFAAIGWQLLAQLPLQHCWCWRLVSVAVCTLFSTAASSRGSSTSSTSRDWGLILHPRQQQRRRRQELPQHPHLQPHPEQQTENQHLQQQQGRHCSPAMTAEVVLEATKQNLERNRAETRLTQFVQAQDRPF